MNTAFVQKQKQQLLELRSRLREEISRMIEAVREEERPPGEHEWTSIPSESAEKEIFLENNEEAIRQAINAALERIERGTFGRCEGCGSQISRARLNAIPYVERCIACEQKLHYV